MAKKKKTQRRAKPRRGAVVRQKRVIYRKVSLTKSGKRTKVERAYSYAIFYGKKQIAFKKFPPTIRGRVNRLHFLELLVLRVENKRLEINRKNRKRKKQTKQVQRIHEDKHLESLRLNTDLADKMYPDFSKIQLEVASLHPVLTPEGVFVSPMVPVDDNSHSQYIEKVVIDSENIHRRLRILKLVLNESVYMTEANYNDTVVECYFKFLPHIAMFYRDTKAFGKKYWLRITYELPGGYKSAISFTTAILPNVEMAIYLLTSTFNLFRKEIVPEFNSLIRRRKDYLADDNELFITGFTLQAREGK